MFYLPFELCNQTEYCTPKGPSFKRAPLVDFSVNGTNIQLRLPRHRTNLPTKAHHPHKAYDLEELRFHNSIMNKPQWGSLPIIFRIWDFYGPWFTGRLGTVSLSLAILCPRSVNKNSSFFHPRAFEIGLADYLTYSFGGEVIDKKQRWLAPVNWNPIETYSSIAVSFDVTENNNLGFASGNMARFLCFPITNLHLLKIEFNYSRNKFIPESGQAQRKPDDWINIAPMKTLVDEIINSVTVTLSPEAQEQQAIALKGMKDKSLVQEFPPLQWN